MLPGFNTDLIDFLVVPAKSRNIVLRRSRFRSNWAARNDPRYNLSDSQIAQERFGVMQKASGSIRPAPRNPVYGKRRIICNPYLQCGNERRRQTAEPVNVSEQVSWNQALPWKKPVSAEMVEPVIADFFWLSSWPGWRWLGVLLSRFSVQLVSGSRFGRQSRRGNVDHSSQVTWVAES